MKLRELGVLDKSIKYFCTPSELAQKLFFYVTRCGHYFCDEDYTFSWKTNHGQIRSRKTYLLFYIISGSLNVRYNGNSFRAIAGQVALIDCRYPHEYWTGNDLEFLWLHFEGVQAKVFYEEIVAGRGHAFAVAKSGAVRSAVQSAVASCRSGSEGTSEIERSQLLYRILCMLLIPESNDMEGWPDDVVNKAIRYIDDHLAEDLNVRTIAEQVSISASHLTRQFKRWTGCSPHEYIVLKRINMAKQLLGTTNMTVKEVAYSVGYNSEANFNTSFTVKVGMSPGNFRKYENLAYLSDETESAV